MNNHVAWRASRPCRRTLALACIPIAAVLLEISGCAVVPAQTVTLSSTVGQDMLAIKKSHIFYINSYYDRLASEANRLIDQEYTPMLVRAVLNGAAGKVLMQELDAGKSGGSAAQDALAFTERFLADVKALVDTQRATLLGGIEIARNKALTQADAAYAQVLQGNTTLTAYLTSLVKLHDAQNELFAAAGVPTFQDELAEKLATASDITADLVAKAKSGDKTLDDVKSSIDAVKTLATGNK